MFFIAFIIICSSFVPMVAAFILRNKNLDLANALMIISSSLNCIGCIVNIIGIFNLLSYF